MQKPITMKANKFLIVIFSIFSLILQQYYYNQNIVSFREGGVAYNVLLVMSSIGICILMVRLFFCRYFKMTVSTYFLIIFQCFLVFRLMADTGDVNLLKAFTVGTTGGIWFFYLMGFLSSFLIVTIYNQAKSSRYATWFCCIFICISALLSLHAFLEHRVDIREDVFLIKDDGSAYQRPGDFISQSFILASTVFIIFFLVKRPQIQFVDLVAKVFVLFFYLLQAALNAGLSAMIGSNKSFLFVSMFFLSTLTIWGYIVFFSTSKKYCLERNDNCVNIVLDAKKLFISLVASVVLMVMAFMLLFSFLDIDITNSRVFGYGTGEIAKSSLESRLEIIQNNFFVHFSDSPILGNMNIDSETTGSGSYVHSVPLFLLTHFGTLGFMIFNSYLVVGLIHVFRYKGFNNAIIYYFLFLFSIVYFIGAISSSITWGLLWFTFGFVFMPLAFKPNLANSCRSYVNLGAYSSQAVENEQ